ncbi:hypothetical protein LRS10_11615 [Phenylobacterium sp. J426]|uniref:hypothetical protein n=1 Tax=Phenylobacterium sp. J426 TaxID=2898439 RepID=UPI002151B5EA|nr:hypothetical protein [Phenylobacterium sp. J426]MCR5874756.1 hypothetical protein [Phenylobacterium sp. J426]
MDGPTFAKLLRALARAVENASPEDVEALINGMSKRPKPVRGRDIAPRRGPTEKIDRIWVEKTLQELGSAASREDALRQMEKLNLSRRELAALAKYRNVHIVKEDNIGTLEQKLVEALVGARLNSLAIRGG